MRKLTLITLLLFLLSPGVLQADGLFLSSWQADHLKAIKSSDLSKVTDIIIPVWLDGVPITDDVDATKNLKNFIKNHRHIRVWGYVQLFRVRGVDQLDHDWFESNIDGKTSSRDGAFLNSEVSEFRKRQLAKLRHLFWQIPVYGIHLNFRMAKDDIFAYSESTRLAALLEIGIDPVDVLPNPGNDPSERKITSQWLNWRERKNAAYTLTIISLANQAEKKISLHGFASYQTQPWQTRARTCNNWALIAKYAHQLVLEPIGSVWKEGEFKKGSDRAKKLNPKIACHPLIYPSTDSELVAKTFKSKNVYYYK